MLRHLDEKIQTDAPLLVDVRAASKLLQLGRTSIHNLVKAGKLARIKVGRSVRFSLVDLQQFIDANREGGAL